METMDDAGHIDQNDTDTVTRTVKYEVLQSLKRNDSDEAPYVSAVCSTGRCDFPSFTTLGMCYQLSNATDQVVEDCIDGTDSNQPSCTFTVRELQSNPPFRHDNASGTEVWLGASYYNTQLNASSNSSSSAQDLNGEQGQEAWRDGTLGDFYILYPSDPRNLGNTSPPATTNHVHALKGTLSLCIYKFKTSVRGGKTESKISSIYRDLNWDLHSKSGSHQGDDVRYRTSLPDDPQHIQYDIDHSTREGLRNYLFIEIFYGTWIPARTSTSGVATTDTARVFGKRLFPAGQRARKNASKRLDGVNLVLERMSLRLTNIMRTTSVHKSSVSGTPLLVQVFIAINFYWLILPLLSIVLALILLLIVIFQSRRLGLPAWKSNQMHTISLLETNAQEKVRIDVEAAKQMRVRLRKDQGENWSLQKEDDEDEKQS